MKSGHSSSKKTKKCSESANLCQKMFYAEGDNNVATTARKRRFTIHLKCEMHADSLIKKNTVFRYL